MADVTFSPQDYASTLAMLYHEAGGPAVQKLLARGDTSNAMGYVSGLIDTWANRAALNGTSMWQEMNKPNQISYWNPANIQSEANQLNPQIKALADAYLSYRGQGGAAQNPNAYNYLNTEVTKALYPNGSWQDWYDPKNVTSAYGDYASGKGSLQTQFLQSAKNEIPDYTFSLDKSMKLAPTQAAQNALTQLRFGPAGLPPGRPEELLGGNLGTEVSGFNPSLLQPFIDAGASYLGPDGANSSGQNPLPVISAAYRDFLKRDAQGEEAGDWADHIGHGGTTLQDVIGQIATSQEANNVRTSQGLPEWNPYSVAAGLGPVGNASMNMLPGTYQQMSPADQFISQAYAAKLGRTADSAGLANFDAALSGGIMDAQGIANALASSPEGLAYAAAHPAGASMGTDASTGGAGSYNPFLTGSQANGTGFSGANVSQGLGAVANGTLGTTLDPLHGSTMGTDASTGGAGSYDPLLGHTSYGSDASTSGSVAGYTPNTGTAVGTDASRGGAGSYDPYISPTDFLNGYNVSGGVQPQNFGDVFGKAYNEFLARNATAEEAGSWADAASRPGSNLTDLIGQIAGSQEANNLRAAQGISPYGFSNANIGTAGGFGNATPDSLGTWGPITAGTVSGYNGTPTLLPETTTTGTGGITGGTVDTSGVGAFTPLSPVETGPIAGGVVDTYAGIGTGQLTPVDTSRYGMNGSTDAANSGAYGTYGTGSGGVTNLGMGGIGIDGSGGGTAGLTQNASPYLDPGSLDGLGSLINGAYVGALGRGVDQSGLNASEGAIRSGAMTLNGLYDSLRGSAEGQAFTPAQALNFDPTWNLYAYALGRAPDAAGYQATADALQAGRSYNSILADMLTSKEGLDYAGSQGHDGNYVQSELNALLNPGNGSFAQIPGTNGSSLSPGAAFGGFGDGVAAMLGQDSPYVPGTGRYTDSQMALIDQAASAQLRQIMDAQSQTGAINAASIGSGLPMVAEPTHGDASTSMGQMTNAMGLSNWQDQFIARQLAAPMGTVSPLQTSFYGQQPKYGLMGGGGPPGSGFVS